MKQDSDTAIDILLRRHARRSATGVAGAKDNDAQAKPSDAQVSSTHMDADELSAYAEGALPERARSRYAAHLADCDACRKIVTQLVISAGVETQESEPVAQTVNVPGRSWRAWLAALLSPPVLRYAAPALALFAVIAVVLIVATRNRNETSLVAKNEPQMQAANTGADEQKTATATTTNTATESPENHGATSSANANTQASTTAAEPPLSQQKAENPATGAPPPPPQDSAASAQKPSDLPVAEPQPSKIQEREAADKQPAPPGQTDSRTETFGNLSKEKDDAALTNQRRRDTDQVASGGGAPSAAARPAEESANNSAFGAGAATSSSVRKRSETAKSAPAPASRAALETAGADEGETETRSVAGKRFRKQNGVWVDTTYNSSRSPLKVKRGTEQYRALVADEPIIGTVAGQLGNVIVVVNGRAYHIY